MSSLRFLADENFLSAILRGLRRRNPRLNIILEWAAQHDRIVLTHDLRTMPDFAYERVAKQQKMPGMIAMRQDIRLGTAIDNILLIAACMEPEELTNVVLRLPL